MQGERGYALRAMNQAVSLQPGYAEAYYRLGLLQKELGNNDAAFAAFSKAIEIKPDNADLQFHLGETYLELRMKKEAKLAFMNAVDLRPDFTEAHYQLGRIYVMFNDIDAAFNEYTILIGLDRKRAYDLFNLIYK
jgi:tetratricopeptide (TPR) repeat protein